MIIKEPTFSVIRFTDFKYTDGSFLVTMPMVFEWRAKRCLVTVEVGFMTNFASIPAGMRNLFPVNGKHRLPALAHDYLYANGGTILVKDILQLDGDILPLNEPVEVHYTREEADELFRAFMISEGVHKTRAQFMYLAVRWFGQSNWGTT